MACENNDLAAIGGGEPFQCRLQALIIILCKAVVEDQREAGAGSLEKLCGGELQTAIDHTMREIVVEGKPPAETIAELTETVGHSADELLINFNDLTMRTENEIRREAVKAAAAGAKAPAVAAAPIIAAAGALADGVQKAERQITR